MSATRLLRLAAVLATLQFAAHLLLFVTYVPRHGPEETAVVEAMQTHRFNFGGGPRSYWDFYYGYGLMSAASVLLEVFVFWLLAGLARADPPRVRPLVAVFLAANLVHAGLCARYFFPTPIVPDLAIGLCLAAAWRAAGAPAR